VHDRPHWGLAFGVAHRCAVKSDDEIFTTQRRREKRRIAALAAALI
jgi:hypothetical protein